MCRHRIQMRENGVSLDFNFISLLNAVVEKLHVVVILGNFQLMILFSFHVRSLKESHCHKTEVFVFHSVCLNVSVNDVL